MRVRREQLLRKLEQIAPGLAPRENIEQSVSFVFKNKAIFTFNDEIACQIPFDHPFVGAVYADPLLNTLNKIIDDEIDLDISEGEMKIRGKSNRSGIKMEKEILLPLDAVSKTGDWKPLDPDFSDAVNITHMSASKDTTRFVYTCVHITPDFLEATDNYQLCRYPIKTPIDKDCLIRHTSIASIVNLGITHISETDDWIHFKNNESELILSCRRWAEDFRALDDFLEVQGQKATLPNGILEAIDFTSIYSKDNINMDQIKVSLKDGKLRIFGEGARGWGESRKNIAYEGPEITFFIQPKLLADIISRTNECIVSENRLKIDVGKYTFVACL